MAKKRSKSPWMRLITGPSSYYRNAANEDLAIEAEEISQGGKDTAKNLPKVFDYYCPRCLHQTNTPSKKCPECKEGILKRVDRDDNREKKIPVKGKKKNGTSK